MTAPLLPPDTSNLDVTLARRWAVQVNTGTLAAPVWTHVLGLSAVDPQVSATRQEAGDYHSGNWGAQVSTEKAWTLGLTVMRKLDPNGLPDPGVEFLRSKDGQIGAGELVEVRWWRTDGLPDAYQGRGSVDFTSAGGEKTALQGATCTINGFGARAAISKPVAVAVNEIQRITFPGVPTAGTFKLKFLGYETAALTFTSVTAATLQTALEGLAGIGSGNVVVTGSTAAGFGIAFGGALAGVDVPQLSVSLDSLTGGVAPRIAVETVIGGRAAG